MTLINVIVIYYIVSLLSFHRNQHDMNEWIEAINLVAATYSAPPLPAPVGSWYNKLICTLSLLWFKFIFDLEYKDV